MPPISRSQSTYFHSPFSLHLHIHPSTLPPQLPDPKNRDLKPPPFTHHLPKMGCAPSKPSYTSPHNETFHSSHYGTSDERDAHKAALAQHHIGHSKRDEKGYWKLGSPNSSPQRSRSGVSGSRVHRTQIIDGEVWLY